MIENRLIRIGNHYIRSVVVTILDFTHMTTSEKHFGFLSSLIVKFTI